MREGEIKGLLSICSNMMVSLPDTNQVRKSLEGLEFNVCIDFFLSKVLRYADVVLPRHDMVRGRRYDYER